MFAYSECKQKTKKNVSFELTVNTPNRVSRFQKFHRFQVVLTVNA